MTLGLLLSFIPWIMLSVLPTKTLQELSVGVIIIFIATIVLNYRDLKKGYILPWATAIFFGFAVITIAIFPIAWVARHLEILVYVTLLLLAWGSLFIGKPFTIQYAREKVEPARWQHPTFIRINQILTATWGTLFLLALGVAIFHKIHPLTPFFKVIISNSITVAGLWFNVWLPKWYRKRLPPQS